MTELFNIKSIEKRMIFYHFSAVDNIQLYARLLVGWDFLAVLNYMFIYVFVFIFKQRKNYYTVTGLCFTLFNNVLHTIICRWSAIFIFVCSAYVWPKLSNFKNCAHFSLSIPIRRTSYKFPFRWTSNHFCMLSNPSLIT